MVDGIMYLPIMSRVSKAMGWNGDYGFICDHYRRWTGGTKMDFPLLHCLDDGFSNLFTRFGGGRGWRWVLVLLFISHCLWHDEFDLNELMAVEK